MYLTKIVQNTKIPQFIPIVLVFMIMSEKSKILGKKYVNAVYDGESFYHYDGEKTGSIIKELPDYFFDLTTLRIDDSTKFDTSKSYYNGC